MSCLSSKMPLTKPSMAAINFKTNKIPDIKN